MKEKKNIDTIFNEGFKNLEATPSPRVWENIQTELNKEKKERKVIPLWIKLGGVAALIALMLTVGNSLYDSSNTIAPSITNETINNSEEQLHENKTEVEKLNNDSQVAAEEKTLQSEDSQDLNTSEDNTSNTNGENKPSNNKLINSSEKSSRSVVASNTSESNSLNTKVNSQKNLDEKDTVKNKLNEGIASSKNASEKTNSENKVKETKEVFINKENDNFNKNKEGIAANNKVEKVSGENQGKNSETINSDKKENIAQAEKTLEKDYKNKKSIFDEIAEKDEVAVTENKKKQKPEQRWNVAPNVAPVYYSNLGNGSSIDPSFADNPQKGDVNMSYGVQVSYALSNRLSVRTGVNNVDLSYSTSGIEVGTGPVAVALSSVDYGSRSIVITAVDAGSFAMASPSNGFGDIMPKSTQGDARLIQNLNYYEVPLELKYAVIDSKIGVNLIGGLSTLFLGNNEISVKADNFTDVLGEANNLSTVSFSTNVGLGLDYKLSKKFTFNIEPMFKYQLNPYTDSSVNFKPYYLGVYSGLSFKF
ncbi:hypothetical protein Aeqsu_1336 [Aequorivita sublithincola DSM 14238]|uniref:Outer membrane protein beta-barrel domain-containing protein n=1 Tax=Aequorivita sublithincola (strain DSM 14238 / LMG 21431 / ACAM 643 / 9-3) TaxID=746697 RepID=I3YV11_AEQSU|nr:outer membrane beta-barrel protein [Aequorivita sublithincola]AFL80829.1 hypothetical protein Aeqsu_1336 [Aequorivita sublithincola DSM 14238]